MRTRSRSRHKIAEPLRIKFHSQEDQFQEDPPVATMTDNRTMAEMLRAPTEGYAEAIVVPPILVEQFELKHSLINMMTSEQFFRLEKDNPHDHIRWFNKITSTIKYRDVPSSSIKLILFPFALAGAARRWLEKEPPRSITTWEDLVSKFINELFPPSRTTSLRNEISNFEQKFGEYFHEACDRYKDLLRAFEIAKLTHAVNQQTSVVTTAMTAMIKQLQANPPPAQVKAVEEICITCGGAHPYYQCLAAGGNTFPEFRDNIQGYVSAAARNYNQELRDNIQEYGSAAAANYNQGNPGYRPQGTSLSNQTNEIRDMMASFLWMNIASPSSSGTLPGNTVANLKSDLKAITTRSGVSYDGPAILPPVVENAPEATKDTVIPTNNGNTEDVQPQVVSSKPSVSTSKPTNTPVSASNPNLQASIPYPSRRNDERNHEKAKDQIEKFYQLFKDMSFEEKLSEMARTPLNEHCSAVLLKKLPEKLGDPCKFLISCDFSGMAECLALFDLGASINLMPYYVWKKLSLPDLTPTCM
nr:hypothetical protein [Tanacetum cinerariifolium]